MLEQEKQTFISKEQAQRMPTYIVKFPENKSDLTEIDCLGLENPRLKNNLTAFGITKISELYSFSDDYLLYEIPGLRRKTLAEIRDKIENFRLILIERERKNPGKPVIIEISPKKSEREKKRESIINYVKTWQEEHPGRRGGQNAAAKDFKISRERVRQILAKYGNEKLKSTGVVSLYELAHQLEVKPKILFNLLRQGKISFGNDKINEFYLSNSPHKNSLKRIPLFSVNIDSLKEELKISQSAEEIMKYLTRSVAQRNKDIFPPLLKLAHEAKFGNFRQISKIYDELTRAGFHLKKIYGSNRGWYYHAHIREASAIIAYLQKNIRENPKLKSLASEDQNQDWYSNLV